MSLYEVIVVYIGPCSAEHCTIQVRMYTTFALDQSNPCISEHLVAVAFGPASIGGRCMVSAFLPNLRAFLVGAGTEHLRRLKQRPHASLSPRQPLFSFTFSPPSASAWKWNTHTSRGVLSLTCCLQRSSRRAKDESQSRLPLCSIDRKNQLLLSRSNRLVSQPSNQ